MREMHRKEFAPPPSSKTMLVLSIVGSRLPRSCCSEGARLQKALRRTGSFSLHTGIRLKPILRLAKNSLAARSFGKALPRRPQGIRLRTLYLEVSKPWTKTGQGSVAAILFCRVKQSSRRDHGLD